MKKTLDLKNSFIIFKVYVLRQENDFSLVAQSVVAYGIDKYIIEGIQTCKGKERIYYIGNDTYEFVS